MEDNERTGIKDLFEVIKKSPGLMIAGVVLVVVVIFLLIKKGPTQPVSQTLPATAGPQYSGNASGGPPINIIIPASQTGNANQAGSASQTGSPSQAGSASPAAVSSAAVQPSGVIPEHLKPEVKATSFTNQTTNPKHVNVPIFSGGIPGQPTYGLLGPGVRVEGLDRSKLPSFVGEFIQGSENRVWYINKNTGKQELLTSGVGGPVYNAGYLPNSPENTPKK